jgi:hypothetical protein
LFAPCPIFPRRILRQPDAAKTGMSLLDECYVVCHHLNTAQVVEGEFACYLDEQKALQWWHRNAAMASNYFVQGWLKNKVYPDFVFALSHHDDAQEPW